MTAAFRSAPVQQGLTLVELLVAMALGLLLVAGMMVLLTGSNRAFSLNSGIADLQENGRFMLQFLKRDLQRAGWTDQDAFPAAREQLDRHILLGAGASEDGVSIAGAPGLTTDVVAVQYHGSRDCLGNAATGPYADDGVTGLVINIYRLHKSANAIELTCNGQPLIRQVERFEVLYGLRSATGALRYVRADAIPDGREADVHTLRIGMVMRNTGPVLKPAVQTLRVLDESFSVSDRYLHKVFTATIVLPNHPRFTE